MKLIAKVNVQHSRKPGEDGKKLNGEPITAAPGESFEIDDKAAAALIASGSAATPEDYARETSASRSSEERIAELEAAKAEAEKATAEAEKKLAEAQTANEKLAAELADATKAKK